MPAWAQFSCTNSPTVHSGFSSPWAAPLGRVRTSHFAVPHHCGRENTTTMVRLERKLLPRGTLTPQKATAPRATADKHHGGCTSGHFLPPFYRTFRNTHPSRQNYFSLWHDLPPGSSAVPRTCVGFPARITWDNHEASLQNIWVSAALSI